MGYHSHRNLSAKTKNYCIQINRRIPGYNMNSISLQKTLFGCLRMNKVGSFSAESSTTPTPLIMAPSKSFISVKVLTAKYALLRTSTPSVLGLSSHAFVALSNRSNVSGRGADTLNEHHLNDESPVDRWSEYVCIISTGNKLMKSRICFNVPVIVGQAANELDPPRKYPSRSLLCK